MWTGTDWLMLCMQVPQSFSFHEAVTLVVPAICCLCSPPPHTHIETVVRLTGPFILCPGTPTPAVPAQVALRASGFPTVVVVSLVRESL